MLKIRVLEWFGGVGAGTQSLKRMYGKERVEIVDYVELDEYAVNSFNAINNTNFKPTNINDVNVNGYGNIDLLIAGFPCQDYSIAGKGKGLKGDRSSLILLTIDKIAEMENKPKHILLENVKGLLSKKHTKDLELIKSEFDKLGYNWNQAMLNSKHFGVPQARERLYMVLTRKDLPVIDISHLEQRKGVETVLRDVLDFNVPTETFKIETKKDKVYFYNQMKQYNNKIIELDLNKLRNQKRDEINKVATLGELLPVVGVINIPKHKVLGQDDIVYETKHNITITWNGSNFRGEKSHYCDDVGCDNAIKDSIKIMRYNWLKNPVNNKTIFKEVKSFGKRNMTGLGGQHQTLTTRCDQETQVMFEQIPFAQDRPYQGVGGGSQHISCN